MNLEPIKVDLVSEMKGIHWVDVFGDSESVANWQMYLGHVTGLVNAAIAHPDKHPFRVQNINVKTREDMTLRSGNIRSSTIYMSCTNECVKLTWGSVEFGRIWRHMDGKFYFSEYDLLAYTQTFTVYPMVSSISPYLNIANAEFRTKEPAPALGYTHDQRYWDGHPAVDDANKLVRLLHMPQRGFHVETAWLVGSAAPAGTMEVELFLTRSSVQSLSRTYGVYLLSLSRLEEVPKVIATITHTATVADGKIHPMVALQIPVSEIERFNEALATSTYCVGNSLASIGNSLAGYYPIDDEASLELETMSKVDITEDTPVEEKPKAFKVTTWLRTHPDYKHSYEVSAHCHGEHFLRSLHHHLSTTYVDVPFNEIYRELQGRMLARFYRNPRNVKFVQGDLIVEIK